MDRGDRCCADVLEMAYPPDIMFGSVEAPAAGHVPSPPLPVSPPLRYW